MQQTVSITAEYTWCAPLCTSYRKTAAGASSCPCNWCTKREQSTYCHSCIIWCIWASLNALWMPTFDQVYLLIFYWISIGQEGMQQFHLAHFSFFLVFYFPFFFLMKRSEKTLSFFAKINTDTHQRKTRFSRRFLPLWFAICLADLLQSLQLPVCYPSGCHFATLVVATLIP